MRYLTLDEVLEIYRRIIEQSGGSAGVSNLAELESALAGSMSLLQFTDFALIPSPSPQGEGSKIQSPSP